MPTDRDKRLSELKELLLEKNYKKNINGAIDKATNIPRSDALKKVMKSKTSDRPVFVISFDPRLPPISNIVRNIGEG